VLKLVEDVTALDPSATTLAEEATNSQAIRGVYCFNPKNTIIATQILKMTCRPRLDEGFDFIRKFERRILYELENIQTNVANCSDEEDFGQEVD
jgi:hypothetical protein